MVYLLILSLLAFSRLVFCNYTADCRDVLEAMVSRITVRNDGVNGVVTLNHGNQLNGITLHAGRNPFFANNGTLVVGGYEIPDVHRFSSGLLASQIGGLVVDEVFDSVVSSRLVPFYLFHGSRDVDSFNGVKLSADGKWGAGRINQDGLVAVINVRNPNLPGYGIQSLGQKPISEAAWLAGTSNLAALHPDRTLSVWDSSSGQIRFLTQPINTDSDFTVLRIAAVSTKIVLISEVCTTQSKKRVVYHWIDTTTGLTIHKHQMKGSELKSLVFSPDGKWLLSNLDSPYSQTTFPNTNDFWYGSLENPAYKPSNSIKIFNHSWTADGRHGVFITKKVISFRQFDSIGRALGTGIDRFSTSDLGNEQVTILPLPSAFGNKISGWQIIETVEMGLVGYFRWSAFTVSGEILGSETFELPAVRRPNEYESLVMATPSVEFSPDGSAGLLKFSNQFPVIVDGDPDGRLEWVTAIRIYPDNFNVGPLAFFNSGNLSQPSQWRPSSRPIVPGGSYPISH